MTDDKLSLVQEQIQRFIIEISDQNTIKLFATVEHGKMLRSKLMLKICQNNEKIIKLCAIVELIHLASLLHDDVIDNSTLRRKKPTVNALFGNHTAVMFGDILYSKAFYELTSFDAFIAKTVSNAVMLLSVGELEDVSMSQKLNTDKDRYLSMLYKKTAILIEASCIAAGFLACDEHEKLGAYGRALGVAFQIIDDILDVTIDDATLGKSAFGDFMEGKTTLPYIYAFNMSNQEEQAKISSLFGMKPTKEDIEWIKSIFEKYGIIELCKKEAFDITMSGIATVSTLQNQELSQSLIATAKQQIERNF